MTYSVYQHWDPLEVCAVGRSYSPEFYKFIKNTQVRSVMERIAAETEEDYQKLITLLESFGVDVVRPTLSDDYTLYLNPRTGLIDPPPMTPRDYTIMLGEDFYFRTSTGDENSPDLWEPSKIWAKLRGDSWPETLPSYKEFDHLPQHILDELKEYNVNKTDLYPLDNYTWQEMFTKIASKGNKIHRFDHEHLNFINSAMYTRIGRDVYVGTESYEENITDKINWLTKNRPQYRWHGVNTGGHADGTFCPVKPGLIVSLLDIPTYKDTFPGWEVVYLPGQSWSAVKPFLDLKEKNAGKWWVPGEELNDEFTSFVNQWMGHWVGYVEETVFDVNMLVIDENNVVCNNYNEEVFEAFDRHGVTPHVVNFRHRYFWDGGLHCITSDISRRGTMQDYFPGRG